MALLDQWGRPVRVQTLTETGVVAMTPFATKEAITAAIAAALSGLQVLGRNQSWQNMLGTRAAGTPYQNNSGAAIMVSLRANQGGGAFVQVSADSSTWVTVGTISQNEYDVISFVVPEGHFYRLTAATTIHYWSELR